MSTHLKHHLMVLLLIFTLLLAASPVQMAPSASSAGNQTATKTVYVDDSNTSGVEDGTLAHPYNTIMEGLGIVQTGDIVMVAAGNYKEKITLKDGVKLQGAGPQITTIDGMQQGSVVTAQNTGPGTIVAAFTITGGTGTPEGGYTYGGGFYIRDAELIIKNCVVTGNSSSDGAGGLQGRDSNIKIENCRFTANSGWWGGAITLQNAQAEILRSTFGESRFGYGGNIFITDGSNVTLVNNLITNTWLAIGIGENATAAITNNTIVNNDGFGIVTDLSATGDGAGTATIKNNILWGNKDDLVNLDATYSDIEDADPGEGNLSIYPMFNNPEKSDYRLRAESLCVDAGNNDGAPQIDLGGDLRPLDGDGDGVATVDMGMDEFNPDAPPPTPKLVFLPAVLRACGVFYQDDFSNPDSGWPVIQESDYRLEYLGGEYRFWLGNSESILAASPDFTVANFTLSVDVRKAGGEYGSYGLIFGLSDDWEGFYTFEIDPLGNYGVYRYSQGNWTELAADSSPAINQGSAKNQLKVVRNDALIEVWANGQKLASLSDRVFTGGRYVGLIGSTFDVPDLDVRFDNFQVESSSCGVGTLAPLKDRTRLQNWLQVSRQASEIREKK